MSTPAHVGLKNEDGTVTSIVVNGDGYPSWTGQILTENYNDPESISELIGLGDCSYIDKKLERRNPDIEEDGVTVAYHRDRGEDWEDVKPRTESEEDFWNGVESWEYAYLFKDGKWLLQKGKGKPKNLTKKDIAED